MKNRSVDARRSVSRLAMITGISFVTKPYTSHKVTPRQNKENMPNERSFADLVFHVLITCGRKAAVVNDPAIKPST